MSEVFHPGKALLRHLRVNSLDNYGDSITKEQVRELIGVTMPEVATLQEFETLKLQELSAIDYARHFLLAEGKYLANSDDRYRILLPHENKLKVDSYLRSATRKMKKAQILLENTPKDADSVRDNTEARIVMNAHSIESRTRYGYVQ